MRRLFVIVGIMAVLLCAAALPAFAADSSLLGSGSTAPANGQQAAAPVEVAADASTSAAGESALAFTGFDASAALVLGVGLTAAGGSAILATRKRHAQ